jgi:hypothetical protein
MTAKQVLAAGPSSEIFTSTNLAQDFG